MVARVMVIKTVINELSTETGGKTKLSDSRPCISAGTVTPENSYRIPTESTPSTVETKYTPCLGGRSANRRFWVVSGFAGPCLMLLVGQGHPPGHRFVDRNQILVIL
jgi:hypothetical protein